MQRTTPARGWWTGTVVVLLVALAAVVVVVEPWHGNVLLTVMPNHGVDTGDLVIIPLLVVAGWLARRLWLSTVERRRLDSLSVGGAALLLGVVLTVIGGLRMMDLARRSDARSLALAMLLLVAAIWFVSELLRHPRWFLDGRGHWWVAGSVLAAGSCLDVVFVPSGTVFGVVLFALYLAWATPGRLARAGLVALATTGVLVNVASLADLAEVDVTMSNDEGGAARATALGVVLAWCGLCSLGQSARGRVRSGPAKGIRMSSDRASADYLLGRNERPVQDALVDVLRPGDEFVDIGANVGFFSLLAARLVGPKGRVLAVEAMADNADALCANAHRNPELQIICRCVAVSSRVGTLGLITAAHPGGAALEDAPRPPDAVGRVLVDTVTVDSMVDDGSIRAPRLVKIDVEGAEADVLAGMARTLRRERPFVLVEIDGADEHALHTRRDAVLSPLLDAGYVVRQLPLSYGGVSWRVEHYLAQPQKADGSVSPQKF